MTLSDTGWQADAACRDADPDLFFEVLLRKQAKAWCVRCPVSRECLAYGLRETDGIWGGLDPAERWQWLVKRRVSGGGAA